MAARLIVLYTKPDDPHAFLEEYKADHIPIVQRWPGVTDMSLTELTGTPRGGEPPYWLVASIAWDSPEAMQEGMRDPSVMEASKQAMGMVGKYGNRAEMCIGADA